MAYLYVDYFAGAAATLSFLWCLISLKKKFKKNPPLNPGMCMWLKTISTSRKASSRERSSIQHTQMWCHKHRAVSLTLVLQDCICACRAEALPQEDGLPLQILFCALPLKAFLPFITPWELLADKSKLSTAFPYMFLFTHGCYCVLSVKNYVFNSEKSDYKLSWLLYTILYCYILYQM